MFKKLVSKMQLRMDRYRVGRLIDKKKPVDFKYGGKVFYLNPDEAAFYHIHNSVKKVSFMAGLLPTNLKTIFDVGANCGLFAAFCSERLPESKVYCFEPSKNLIPIIESNVGDKNVEINDFALGEKEGFVDFYVNSESEQTNSMEYSAVEGYARKESISVEKVECISINSFCERRNISKIDVLKVDVQGYESKVLRGASKYLTGVDMLFVESWWRDIEGVFSLFPFSRKYGFRYIYVLNSVDLGADLLLTKIKLDKGDDIFVAFMEIDDIDVESWC